MLELSASPPASEPVPGATTPNDSSPVVSAPVDAAAAPSAFSKTPRNGDKRSRDIKRKRELRAAEKAAREGKIAKKLEDAGGTPQSSSNEAEAGSSTVTTTAAPSAAEFVGTAMMLWAGVAERVKETRYTLEGPEVDHVLVGETKVPVTSKMKLLVDATAPVLAKYMPEVTTSAEGALCLAVVMVFGMPAIGHARELLFEGDKPLATAPPDEKEEEAAA